jgi:hypothetical protein
MIKLSIHISFVYELERQSIYPGSIDKYNNLLATLTKRQVICHREYSNPLRSAH